MMLKIIKLLLINFCNVYTATNPVDEAVSSLKIFRPYNKTYIGFYFNFYCNMKSFMRIIKDIIIKLGYPLGKISKNNSLETKFLIPRKEYPQLFKKMLDFSSDKNSFIFFMETFFSLSKEIRAKINSVSFKKFKGLLLDLNWKGTNSVKRDLWINLAYNFVTILQKATEFNDFDSFQFFLDNYLRDFIVWKFAKYQERYFDLKVKLFHILRKYEEIPYVDEESLKKHDGSFDLEEIVKCCKKFRGISINICRLFGILHKVECGQKNDPDERARQLPYFLNEYLKIPFYFYSSSNIVDSLIDYQRLPDEAEKVFMELGFDNFEAKTLLRLFSSFFSVFKNNNNPYGFEFYVNLMKLFKTWGSSDLITKIGGYFFRRALQMNDFIKFFKGLISNGKNENSNGHEEEIKN